MPWRLRVAIVLVSLVATLFCGLAPPPPRAAADATGSCQRSSRRRGARAHARPSARRSRSRGPRLTAAERRAIRRRHTEAPRAAIDRWLEESPPSLVLRPANGGGEFLLTPEDDQGGFGDDDLAVAERALASREDGATHAVEPRLLDLVYQAARHFRAPWVHVVSGYRPGRATSRHTHGRALDFVLPGTSDRRLAAWLRRLGFVGVGIYPTSGFVHLDVRERSYFWTDASGPREENRERPMLRELWARYDREARSLGIEPTSDEPIRLARAEAGAEGEAEGEASEGLALAGGEAAETSPPGEAASSRESAGPDGVARTGPSEADATGEAVGG